MRYVPPDGKGNSASIGRLLGSMSRSGILLRVAAVRFCVSFKDAEKNS
jgi:hypothetical protein